VRFIAVLENTVGADYNYLDLLISRFLFPIRYLVTKSDLRCFVALAGILPAEKDCRSNSYDNSNLFCVSLQICPQIVFCVSPSKILFSYLLKNGEV